MNFFNCRRISICDNNAIMPINNLLSHSHGQKLKWTLLQCANVLYNVTFDDLIALKKMSNI